MSLNFNQIAKLSIAAGAALVTTIAANLAPAQAANLNFSFTTENGSGSFNLNTSAVDEEPDVGFGSYTNAITDVTFNGDLLSSGGFLSISNDAGNTDWIFVSAEADFFLTLLDPSLNLVDQLSSNPSDYNFVSGFILTSDNSMNITGLTATDATAVPEPTATVSLLALGALGAGSSLRKRKIKKQESLTA